MSSGPFPSSGRAVSLSLHLRLQQQAPHVKLRFSGLGKRILDCPSAAARATDDEALVGLLQACVFLVSLHTRAPLEYDWDRTLEGRTTPRDLLHRDGVPRLLHIGFPTTPHSCAVRARDSNGTDFWCYRRMIDWAFRRNLFDIVLALWAGAAQCCIVPHARCDVMNKRLCP